MALRGSIELTTTRLLRRSSVTTRAALANAASVALASPVSLSQSNTMLPGIWSNSCAAPEPIASLASVTAGSVSYSTSIASAASRAAAKVSATTSATGWPTWRTLPSASTGRGVSCRGLPSRLMSGTVQGTSPRPSARTSSPVPTNNTPGMRRAAAASMRLICACATGERSTKACVIRGSTTSSV